MMSSSVYVYHSSFPSLFSSVFNPGKHSNKVELSVITSAFCSVAICSNFSITYSPIGNYSILVTVYFLPEYSDMILFPPHFFGSFNSMAGIILLYVWLLVPMYTIAYDPEVIIFIFRSGFFLPRAIVSGLILS